MEYGQRGGPGEWEVSRWPGRGTCQPWVSRWVALESKAGWAGADWVSSLKRGRGRSVLLMRWGGLLLRGSAPHWASLFPGLHEVVLP